MGAALKLRMREGGFADIWFRCNEQARAYGDGERTHWMKALLRDREEQGIKILFRKAY